MEKLDLVQKAVKEAGEIDVFNEENKFRFKVRFSAINARLALAVEMVDRVKKIDETCKNKRKRAFLLKNMNIRASDMADARFMGLI